MQLGKILVCGLKERQMWEDRLEAAVAWIMVIGLTGIALLASSVLGGLIE